MAINIAITIITATATPAGVIPPPGSFLELFGVSAAVRGFVGTAVLGVDEALVVAVIVDWVGELELAEVLVGSDDEDSELVEVRSAGAGIVVPSSSSSLLLSS